MVLIVYEHLYIKNWAGLEESSLIFLLLISFDFSLRSLTLSASTNEQIFNERPVTGGVYNLTFVVPHNASLGETYTRFRVNILGNLSFDGLAEDGGRSRGLQD